MDFGPLETTQFNINYLHYSYVMLLRLVNIKYITLAKQSIY